MSASIKKESIPIISEINKAFQPRKQFPDYRVLLANLKGHQTKAFNKMTQIAPQINLILELRDARAPISSSNVLIDKIFRNKEKIIVYTKKDQSSLSNKLLDKWHYNRNEKWVSVDCRKPRDVAVILEELKKKHKSLIPPPPLGLRLMVVGMPNVGKSTLVNGLRRKGMCYDQLNAEKKFKKVAQTGNQAGVTRNTSEIIRISSTPEILLYDTPGVLLPQVDNIKTMLSLYLIGTVNRTEGIDPVIATDYLLYMMNSRDNKGKGYLKYLKHPTNDIYELLDAVGKKTGNRNKSKVDGKYKTNYVGCAIELINQFQKGKLGKWCLDEAVVKALDAEAFSEQVTREKDRVDDMNTKFKVGETIEDGEEGGRVAKSRRRRREERLVKQSNQLFL